MQIALLPPDERPVNMRLPVDVAAIAGGRVLVPRASIRPSMRRPGDTSARREDAVPVIHPPDPGGGGHGLVLPRQRPVEVDFEVTVG